MSDAGVEMESGGSSLVQFSVDYEKYAFAMFLFRSEHSEFSIIPCWLCTLENDHVRFLSVEISFNLFYLENISSTEEIN